jgi:predicted transcriptional regulator
MTPARLLTDHDVPAGARDVREMRISELMHAGLASCQRDATAVEIARIMSKCRVHLVVVMGVSPARRDQPMIWGVVTDLDLLDALRTGKVEATAEDLAGGPVIRIRCTKSVLDAAETMIDHRAQHLVVVDSEGNEPLGIISTLDLARVLAR